MEPHGGIFVKQDGRLYLNVHKPWAIQPIKDPTPEYLAEARRVWAPWFQVNAAIFARARDPDTGAIYETPGMADWVIKWRAFTVQNQHVNNPISLVVQSDTQGIGKDAGLQPLELCVGLENVGHVDQDALDEQYDEYLTKKVIIFNEVVLNKKNLNNLKVPMTNRRGPVRAMFNTPELVTYCNIMQFNTNEEEPVDRRNLEKSRRLMVFFSAMSPEEKARFEGRGGVYEQLDELPYRKVKMPDGSWSATSQPDTEKLQMWLTLMDQVDLSDYDERNIDLDFNAAKRLSETQADPVQSALRDMIENGTGPLHKTMVVPFKELLDYCVRTSETDIHDSAFSALLVKEGFSLFVPEGATGRQIEFKPAYQAKEIRYWIDQVPQLPTPNTNYSREYRDADPRGGCRLKFVAYYPSKELYARVVFGVKSASFLRRVERRKDKIKQRIHADTGAVDPLKFSPQYVYNKNRPFIYNAVQFYALMDLFGDKGAFLSRMFYKYGWSRFGYGDNPRQHENKQPSRRPKPVSYRDLIMSMDGTPQMGKLTAADLLDKGTTRNLKFDDDG